MGSNYQTSINKIIVKFCQELKAYLIKFEKLQYRNTTAMSLSDFIILAKIGEGAYSSVHKVKRISDGNTYALKKVKINNLKQKQKQNALNEVRLLASISSDYIIKYKEAFFDTKSNTLCIVIEYADGGDLEKIIEKKKKTTAWFDEKEIQSMMKQILSGLSILHERNIIHRDIKCANIFISGGIYKIADLNVSKLLKKDLAYTQTGTPYYASPQVWQDKPYQTKSDIWSFGCIVYEMCTLKPPFTATSMQGLYKKVMKGSYPKIPSTYSNRLSAIIDLCMQIDPNKRPSAKELLKKLDEGKAQTQHKPRISSVNLLNTIKIPRNLEAWKQQLPKADYEDIQKDDTNYHPKFGNISQNRLREIVRMKNQQAFLSKKQTTKKIEPQTVATIRSNEPKIVDKNFIRKSQLQVLPRLKLYSEPNERQKINELLSKLKEQERKKYDYNRPSWWG